MFPALPFPARASAAAIALIALLSVIGQFLHLNEVRYQNAGETAWEMARFFTILTNLLVAWTWARAAFRRNGVDAAWLAALTVAIVLVGAVYHALLSHLVEYTGVGAVADIGLHTIVPLACLVWWLFMGPKRSLVYSDLPVFAVWPAIYGAYVFARGAADGDYPYPFLNLNTLSPAAVATNLTGLMLVLLLGGVIMISIGRYADR